MGFSLSSITKPLKKVAGIASAFDPTGISSMLTTGLGLTGGSGGGTATTTRKRYQRKKRNKWQSKRQKKNRNKQMLRVGVKDK